MSIFKKIVTWWNGATVGTAFFTWRKGTCVGSDQFGNTYYEGSHNKEGRKKRWVIYKNYPDPTMIPPGWSGWIHYRSDTPSIDEIYIAHEWEKPHQPNWTGTKLAYKPKGSIGGEGRDHLVTGEYVSWIPPQSSTEKDV